MPARGRKTQVGAAEGNDARIGVGSRSDGQAIGPGAGTEDGVPGFDAAVRVLQDDRPCDGTAHRAPRSR